MLKLKFRIKLTGKTEILICAGGDGGEAGGAESSMQQRPAAQEQEVARGSGVFQVERGGRQEVNSHPAGHTSSLDDEGRPLLAPGPLSDSHEAPASADDPGSRPPLPRTTSQVCSMSLPITFCCGMGLMPAPQEASASADDPGSRPPLPRTTSQVCSVPQPRSL